MQNNIVESDGTVTRLNGVDLPRGVLWSEPAPEATRSLSPEAIAYVDALYRGYHEAERADREVDQPEQ